MSNVLANKRNPTKDTNLTSSQNLPVSNITSQNTNRKIFSIYVKINETSKAKSGFNAIIVEKNAEED